MVSKALTVDEMDPKNWGEKIWACSLDTGNTESLNSPGTTLPVDIALISLSEKICPTYNPGQLGMCVGMDPRAWDQCGRNIKSDPA